MRGAALALAVLALGAELGVAARLSDARPRSGWTAYAPLAVAQARRIYEYPTRFSHAPPGAVPARVDVLPAEHIEIQVIR